jgi:hypothetical protein
MVTRAGPVVYVASKLSGDIETNVERTKGYSRFVIEQGGVPINPILNLNGVIEEETGRELAMYLDIRILEKADELWVFGMPSAGMLLEIEAAERMMLPIRTFTTDLKEI